MKISKRAGGAVILALCSVAFASCQRQSSGTQSQQSETSDLHSAVHDADVRAFYDARGWQPVWSGDHEREILAALDSASTHGLRADLFLPQPLPQDRNAREAALTKAALDYAKALAGGYADPTRLNEVYTIPRPKVDVSAGLAQAIDQGKVGAWLTSLAPQTDEYRALSQAETNYLKIAGAVKSSQVPAGDPIKPGSTDARIMKVATALAINGYAGASAQPAKSYSGALVAAVRKMQADYGLKPTGVIDADTLSLLNGGAGFRARQIAVALERLRWLERTPAPTRIDVNTAASFLDYWRDGAHQQQLRVINGQPDEWATPQIQAPMFQLVANPDWTVPDHVYKDELSKKSQAYLSANGFAMKNGRMVQKPGPKNSLGIVKFDMQDKEQIYLHDTPFKSWFATDDRHRSHGCVRVQDALAFATQLATEDAVQDEFARAMASKEETEVKLKRQIPVRMLYHTAYWDGAHVVFAPDIYGWDDNVARALKLQSGPPRKIHQRQEDVGP